MAVALPYIYSALAAAALSFVASQLLAPKAKTPVVDEKPNSPTTRGSYVPIVIGRRRVGPNVVWYGDRTSAPGPSAGGKGGNTGGATDQLVYRESAHHVICVGPGHGLHRIWSNGKIIFAPAGGIDNLSHPSGTSISTELGTFKIYWGEADGPVDTFLSSASRIGVLSRWKYLVRVVWIQARLGGFPTWPAIEYEIEVRPYKPGFVVGANYDSLPERLAGSTAWMGNEEGLTGTPFSILDVFDYTEKAPRGEIKLALNQTASFPAQASVTVTGQSHSPFVNKTPTISSATFLGGEVGYSNSSDTSNGLPASLQDINWIKINAAANNTTVTHPDPAYVPKTIVSSFFGNSYVVWNNGVPTALFLGRWRSEISIDLYQFGSGSFVDITIAIGASDGAPVNPILNSHGVRLRFIGGETVGTAYNGADFSVSQVNANWKRVTVWYYSGHGTTPSTDALRLKFIIDVSSIVAPIQVAPRPLLLRKAGTLVSGITTLKLHEHIVGGDSGTGTIDAWLEGYGPGGPNAAHTIYQLMFETFPHGAGLDPALFDLTSLEEVGSLLAAEGLRTNIVAQDGNEFEAILGNILQDVGMFVSWDRVRGLFVFSLIRNPDDLPSIPYVPEQLISDPKPERFSQREARAADKAIFGFADRALSYRDNVVVESDDSLASIDQNQKGDIVPMPTVIDERTALKVAERRSAELLTTLAKTSVTVLRDAGDFYPGQPCNVYDFDSTQRILEVKAQAKSRRTVLEIATDNYAIIPGSQKLQVAYSPPPAQEPVADLSVAIIELPEELRLASKRAVAILRIRAEAHIGASAAHLSGDDLTYIRVAEGVQFATGGRLFEELAASGVDIATGPVFYGMGPDVAALSQSLTDDDRDLGRQLLICGDEIMFVKEIVPLGENMYRPDGIQRGKYGTAAVLHAVDEIVYIVNPRHILPIYDPLIEASVTVYAKTQPRTASAEVTLAAVSSVNHTITALPPTPITEFFAEIPTGAIDGVNASFVLVNAPNPPESLILVKNGLDQRAGVGDDYQISGATITFEAGNIPQTGDTIVARRYLSL